MNRESKHEYGRLLVLLVLVLAVAIPVKADTIVVDQTNTGFVGTTQNIGFFSPFGQSFTPTLASLNFVSLWTDGGFGSGATVQVNLRSGSISGTILGTSQTATVVNTFVGPTTFNFTTAVTLVPSTLYFIDVQVLSGSVGGGTTGNTYAGGDQILLGAPQSDNDLWFQEGTTTPGTAVPEPSSLLLFSAGALGGVAAARRKLRG